MVQERGTAFGGDNREGSWAVQKDLLAVSPSRSKSIVEHSDDFQWGITGSGAAQLALELLLDVTSENEALLYYQRFKRDVVSRFPSDGQWTMAISEIDAFITTYRFLDSVG